MNIQTFAYWRVAPDMECPLVVNQGEPSEVRLIARGRYVHIYHYTKNFRPKRRAATGRNPANQTTPQNTMAKKAPAPAAKKAAPAKMPVAKIGSKMPAKKGMKGA
jgi:hypothetical protein